MKETLYGVDVKKSENNDKRVMAIKSILAVAGNVVSGPIVVKNNRLRGLKGDLTLTTFTTKFFEEMETNGLGKIARRLANNNSTVSIMPFIKISFSLFYNTLKK